LKIAVARNCIGIQYKGSVKL